MVKRLILYYFMQSTNLYHIILIKSKWVLCMLHAYFDETLKWNEHVDFVNNSFIKYFGIFNHIKNKITEPIVRQLYYAFIY